jgi:catechol 2,3-dioxygenase-like lactoylglutathione lyase family enzyme
MFLPPVLALSSVRPRGIPSYALPLAAGGWPGKSEYHPSYSAEEATVIKDLDHLALVTTDAERAARFLIDLLGFKESGRIENTPHSGTIIFISLGGTQIELFGTGEAGAAPASDRAVGFKHLALSVDDIDAEYGRLKAAGVEFGMVPTTVESGLRIAFFKDPDGNALELMQRPK